MAAPDRTGADPAVCFTGLMSDSIGDLMLVVDPASLEIVAANSRAESLLAPGGGSLVGGSIRDLEPELVGQAYWDEAASGQFTPVKRVDTVYMRRDGFPIHVEKSTYLRDLDGRPFIVIHSRETGERHAIEEELERAASQLRATLESTADGILVTDQEGRIVNLNHQFSRLWHIPDDIMARHDDQAVWSFMGRALSETGSPLIRAMASGDAPEASVGGDLTLRDGRVLEYVSNPRYSRGGVVGRVFCFRDITDKIAREQELIEARDLAARANEAKSAFLASMSHEIRTPMNGILGMTELALEMDLGDTQREYIEAAHESAMSLLAIINDILDFSKIEAGRLDLEAVAFDPRELLNGAIRILAHRAGEQDLELLLDIPPDLPDLVVGDPVRLRQVLLNLLGNAVKFTQRGEIVLSARREPASGEDEIQLLFCVRDTGIGIAPEQVEAIFDSFSQADNTITRRFGGTGLGLAISRRLVEAMGGKIWVESELGRGSAFRFTVRLEAPPARIQVSEDPQYDVAAPGPAAEGNNLRVLVAEDDPVNRKIVQIMLARAGHQCVLAGNGREALEHWRTGAFDLILMDINMPEMGGIDATRHIRERERNTGSHIPIVALTANALVQDRQIFLDAGMDGYVSKPYRFDDLIVAIRGVMPAD